MTDPTPRSPRPRRVFMLGATGTIGRATVRALLRRGHEVVCFVRPQAGVGGRLAPDDLARLLPGATLRFGDVTRPESLVQDGFRGEHFDSLVSCMASRTGAPRDAWAIDHQAHVHALAAARAAGVTQVVLLSAICVQKPLLAFQQAKLAFERQLVESGLTYSIVRATAFFKSLSGQVERVRQGKPFLVFGDGRLTACKPISDDDLGDYLAGCLDDTHAPRPHPADRRARRGHHAARAGRALVRTARPAAAIQAGAGGPARHHHRRAGPARALRAAPGRQGRAGRRRATAQTRPASPA
jgi:divinyl chlorophyllide a 8-vinyl-reductase